MRRPRSSDAILSIAPRLKRSPRRSRPSAPRPRCRRTSTTRAYRAAGGYATLLACRSGERTVDAVIAAMENSGLRGLGRRGFRRGPQVENRARRAGAAADGGQHRRGRAGHVQGPLLPRARSASLSRGHADRRMGRRHRRYLRLPARRVRRVPRDTHARACGARGRSSASRCRAFICAAAPARTSAAKSRR